MVKNNTKTQKSPYEDTIGEKDFRRSGRIGIIIELLIAILAIIIFILTEDIKLPIQIIDRYTPVMILILICNWIMDVLLQRYRKVKAEESDNTSAAK